MSKIIHPISFQIYIRRNAQWFVQKRGQVFFNPKSTPAQLNNIAEQFGLTNQKVVIELFRINGGENGYYLADIKNQNYYYCGQNWEDISLKLRDLGIGREDPFL